MLRRKVIKFGVITAVIFTQKLMAFTLTEDAKCKTKRLDEPPGVAAKVPIQDQDGTRLCTAYSASQLIDCWRIANDPGFQFLTSPISLGLEHAAQVEKPNLNGFKPTEIITNARNLNSCSYDVVRDHFNGKSPSQFLQELSDYYKQAQESDSAKKEAATKTLQCVLRAGLGMQSIFSIEQIKDFLSEKNRLSFIDKIFNAACSKNKGPLRSIPPIVMEASYKKGNQVEGMTRMRDLINKRLDMQNPQPLGITYCRDVLVDSSITGVSPQGTLDSKLCKGEIHSSVIVGRRLLRYKNGDKISTICQFLVRDSYGSSCSAYPDDPAALPSKKCENGQVWVDEDALMANTNEVYHLKDN